MNIIEQKLFDWTNEKWVFFIVDEIGEKTIEEKNENEEKKKFEAAKTSNEMKKVFEVFPEAELQSIKDIND